MPEDRRLIYLVITYFLALDPYAMRDRPEHQAHKKNMREKNKL